MSGVPFGPPALASLWAAELPQKDELCGSFWGSLALRSFGFAEVDGEPVDQRRPPRSRGDARRRRPCAVGAARRGHAGRAILGSVKNLWGDVLEEIRAPGDGVVLFLTTSPAVGDDGLVLGLGAGLTPVEMTT